MRKGMLNTGRSLRSLRESVAGISGLSEKILALTLQLPNYHGRVSTKLTHGCYSGIINPKLLEF